MGILAVSSVFFNKKPLKYELLPSVATSYPCAPKKFNNYILGKDVALVILF